MTSAQRLFFEVNGYVVIEHTLTQSECRDLLTALSELRTRFEAEVNPAEAIIDGSRWERYEPPHYLSWFHLLQAPGRVSLELLKLLQNKLH